jgi:hypothetical protein
LDGTTAAQRDGGDMFLVVRHTDGGQGRADLIAFGRKFIANPDLPERLRVRAPFNTDDPTTYYGGGEKGYTDYPSVARPGSRRPAEILRRPELAMTALQRIQPR